MFVMPDQEDYAACIWATKAMKDAAERQINAVLRALTMGKRLKYNRVDSPVPGFEFAPHYKWALSVGSTYVMDYTKAGAECKMLAAIMRDHIGFPLFRGVKPREEASDGREDKPLV